MSKLMEFMESKKNDFICPFEEVDSFGRPYPVVILSNVLLSTELSSDEKIIYTMLVMRINQHYCYKMNAEASDKRIKLDNYPPFDLPIDEIKKVLSQTESTINKKINHLKKLGYISLTSKRQLTLD